jgi:hypothetical protein
MTRKPFVFSWWVVSILLSAISVQAVTIPITTTETIINFDMRDSQPPPPYTNISLEGKFDPSSPLPWNARLFLKLYGCPNGTGLITSYDFSSYARSGSGFMLITSNQIYAPMYDGMFSIGFVTDSGIVQLVSLKGCGNRDGTNTCQSYPITLSIVAPNGGEQYLARRSIEIEYAPYEFPVNLEYSSDNGSSWLPIVSGALTTGTFEWTAPDIESAQCRVRVSAATAIGDTSDNPFTIHRPCVRNPADINDDCFVNLEDLAILAQNWLWDGNL